MSYDWSRAPQPRSDAAHFASLPRYFRATPNLGRRQ